MSGCGSVVYNGTTYTSSTIINDTIKSYQGCDSIYNIVTINITTALTPSVSLSSTSTVANGSPVTFTASATNGGSAPVYSFTVNSSVVQTGSSNTYTSSTLNVGDIVSCNLTSNATCISTTTANSNSITMITNVPVTLVSFKAYLSEYNAKCVWQTSTEINAAYYVVQRSINGAEFIDLGRIQATGNSNVINNYNYTDLNAAELKVNAIYYRLQMFDKDGHSTYSKVVMIALKTKFDIGLYPNPAKDKLNVKIYNTRSLKGTLLVTDIQGRVLIQQSLNLDANVDGNSISINTTSFKTGNYMLVIKDENGIEQKQFMKQ